MSVIIINIEDDEFENIYLKYISVPGNLFAKLSTYDDFDKDVDPFVVYITGIEKQKQMKLNRYIEENPRARLSENESNYKIECNSDGISIAPKKSKVEAVPVALNKEKF
ncbi:hypothetical protein PGB90_006425 [Kerria lacca]